MEFLGWTPGNAKLLLPPRQSRGNSGEIRTDPLEASVVACQWLQESGLRQRLPETTALARSHIDVYLVYLRSECLGRSAACNGSTNKVFYLAEFRTLVGNRKHQSFASGTFST
jgi:hypothetical protein